MTSAAPEPRCEPALLAELKPVLALFAQALAGRAVALREGTHGTEAAPPPAAAAQPIELALPRQIASFVCARDNRAAYRIAVMRQVVAASSDEALAAALIAASRWWRRAFDALERLRVDGVIERKFPGARADLAQQRTLELLQRRGAAARRWPSTRALDLLWRHALGDADTAHAAADVGSQAMLRHADALRRVETGAVDSARAATAICGLLGVPAYCRRRRSAPLPAMDALPALLAAAGSNPANTRSADGAGESDVADAAFASAEARSINGGASRPGDAPQSPAVTTGAALPGPRTARRLPHEGQRGATLMATLAGDDAESGTTHPIDEWDYRQQRLLPAWCTLIERRLRGSDTAFIHHVRRRHAALARRVHRQFVAWRPEGLQRVHGASDGDELEIDRVIEAMVDLRAGLVDDRAWYVRRDRAQRDVATALLVDTSASTDFVLPDGVTGPPRPTPSAHADAVYLYDLAVSAPPSGAPKRRVIDVAKEALALMCDALHTLGDCFAIYTFSGHGRARVEFRVVKAFHEAVSPRTAAALAALRPHGATRTGAAIRHTVAQLLRQPQRRRTLIVVTDGYPEDVDYGPLPRDLQYGLEDTAHALLEAQAAGVQTFCLSIDPAGHDYLRRMCPPERYLVIGDLVALPAELAKVYHAMTRPTT